MTEKTLDELLAEYVVLEQYDRLRELAGHDYGSGQRAAELHRRRRAIRRLSEQAFVELETGALNLDELDLVGASERVGRPRLKRVERDSENSYGVNEATVRTIRAWRRTLRLFELQAAQADGRTS